MIFMSKSELLVKLGILRASGLALHFISDEELNESPNEPLDWVKKHLMQKQSGSVLAQ